MVNIRPRVIRTKLLAAPPVMHVSQSGFRDNEAYDIENKAGLLFITTCPPRECGIATYTQDLIGAIRNKFEKSFSIHTCPVTTSGEPVCLDKEVAYRLFTDQPASFTQLAISINKDHTINLIVLQHEFGLFKDCRDEFVNFLGMLKKPLLIVFHTVLPDPGDSLRAQVRLLADVSNRVMVMTNKSSDILIKDYGLEKYKITMIPHGTHLVLHTDCETLKRKYKLTGRKVLTTFGLLSSGKGIETTLNALPEIVASDPEVIFLVIGKTHPAVIRSEGEVYRQLLEKKVTELGMTKYVRFINYFLPLGELLEYLQLTDVYLFTSQDRSQAVSGTFSYAISCGCPVVSTPIPHAVEVLKNDGGIIIDFGNSAQLGAAVTSLLQNKQLRANIVLNGLHRMAPTAWENAAIAHAFLFQEMLHGKIDLQYKIPPLNTAHIREMTTSTGIYQFSVLHNPDPADGYTLDDNARALVATCQHFEKTGDPEDLEYISIYLQFIRLCQQPDGSFLNYMNQEGQFTKQNDEVNLDDANGRAVWALGYVVSRCTILPEKFSTLAFTILQQRLATCEPIHSTRAMAFIIKGLYYKTTSYTDQDDVELIRLFADRLVQMYLHETDRDWHWFEGYLTYANSLLPEALLCAWLATGNMIYKEIAKKSFDFLLAKIFHGNRITVISNHKWLHDRLVSEVETTGGEQPIDVAYTIMALKRFYTVFRDPGYYDKMQASFNWFLGENHLHQIIYNPCTGGCYDGLESDYVNLNQGAESTVSYLMARLTIDEDALKRRLPEEEEILLNEIYETQSV
ncbi:MAG TPA: glycosyltransferase [Chitinophagaceae bacterium]|nr:glycosyltransferase [Chitinophagaceae bacterium]HPH30618.1 glycosyltransferase [Chitinophagaceae bacterium]